MTPRLSPLSWAVLVFLALPFVVALVLFLACLTLLYWPVFSVAVYFAVRRYRKVYARASV